MDEFNLSSCTASIRTEPHPEYPTRLYYISGAVTHPTFGEIASLRGYFLSVRYAWKQAGDFAEILGDESEELDYFCSDVFDPNFNVHSWLIDGGRRSGTGCWGRELNSGDVVYLEEISVKNQYRRRGVGSKLLGELFSSPDILPPFSLVGDPHFYCWPTGEAEQSQASVVAFFHKNGFRRVGLGNFMCCSIDPNHLSRFVPITDDPEPPTPQYPNTANLTPDELEHAYYLHSAVSSKKGREVIEIIKSAYTKDPGSIHKRGRHGYTPIHVAAEWFNIDAIRTLLELGVSEDLNDVQNRSGATALEIFTATLQFRRRLAEDRGTWDGYSTEELAIEYALQSTSNVPLSSLTEEEYISKRKLGCTCGQCTDGWLSPRMRHRLSVSAIVEFDTSMLELGWMSRRPSATKPRSIDRNPVARSSHHHKQSIGWSYHPLTKLRFNMRASFIFFVFSTLAVSNVLANPLYDDLDLQEREFAENSLDTRSPHHGGPSATIHINLRDIIEDLDARYDLEDFDERDLLEDDILESREPHHGGPSATINIHLRDLADELEVEGRDYFEDADELDARSFYDDELEEREFGDIYDEFEARDDVVEMEARGRKWWHFRVGTVILPSSDD